MLRYFYNKYASEKTKNRVSIVRAWIRRLLTDRFVINNQQKRNNLLQFQLKNKEQIRVAFFIFSESEWKYGDLYNLLKQNKRFLLSIVICPECKKEQISLVDEMEKTSSFFQKEGYNVISTYDKKNNRWIDVKKEFKPDIIFWGFPYPEITKEIYRITNYTNSLSCYVPYFWGTTDGRWVWDLLFHNMLWILFCETQFHKEFYKKKSRMHGNNVYVSGYPPFDFFLKNQNEFKSNFKWKVNDSRFRKVIWAPHHIISDGGQSTFLRYFDVMLEVATIYKDKIQFVFKPHPLLKSKLYNLKNWGKERTDNYYYCWDSLPNTMLWEGEYSSLFRESDALLHDCGSFMVEYLFTLRPVLYFASENRLKTLNELAVEAYNLHYIGNSKDDIYNFIELVVLNGEDRLYPLRKDFCKKILPPNELTAAENIYKKIISYI
ncbi:CDP-glycerol glycerophosphotransferase family protein [Parabacteroides sp.]